MWEKAELVLARAGDAAHFEPGHTVWSSAMGLQGLFWILLIAVAIAALVVLIRSSARSGAKGETSALAVLAVRYARGEIERGEYLERKRDLS